MKRFLLFSIIISFTSFTARSQDVTYAEKLGWPKGAKVIILHVDDAGMSHDSNEGAINATSKGVANSMSVMMPCPWVPEIVKYLKEHPTVDAGLHLTLTAEWDNYRWVPLSGKAAVPGLVDEYGCLWPEPEDVVKHASADEIDKEIRAQLDRALTMGFVPTHLDSHMGTLFASQAYLEKYIKLGIEKQIPVMLPGGHNSYIRANYQQREKKALQKAGKWKDGMALSEPAALKGAAAVGKMVWNAGLPVLDDLATDTGDNPVPDDAKNNDTALRDFYTKEYTRTLQELKPGLTMVIMHCTQPSEIFGHISGSGTHRKGDMLAMMDPALKTYIQQQGIILTTWREVMERRKRVGR
ncbi:MAG: polysaccharide deacetylase family protein [Agriterribacter sp.]